MQFVIGSALCTSQNKSHTLFTTTKLRAWSDWKWEVESFKNALENKLGGGGGLYWGKKRDGYTVLYGWRLRGGGAVPIASLVSSALI